MIQRTAIQKNNKHEQKFNKEIEELVEAIKDYLIYQKRMEYHRGYQDGIEKRKR